MKNGVLRYVFDVGLQNLMTMALHLDMFGSERGLMEDGPNLHLTLQSVISGEGAVIQYTDIAKRIFRQKCLRILAWTKHSAAVKSSCSHFPQQCSDRTLTFAIWFQVAISSARPVALISWFALFLAV